MRTPALSRLPGLVVHFARHTPRTEDLPDRPRAAVAVVLAPDPDSVLVIRRAERADDRWSGQLAFPGGRWDPADADLIATARRETAEEVGIDLAGREPVAVLDDLAPRTPVLPPILVRPYLFTLPGRLELLPNHEVAGAWWVPLDHFLPAARLQPVEFPRYGTLVRTVGYQLDIGVLWGMSERILTPLLRHL